MKRFLLVAVASLTLPLWAHAAAGDLDPSFGSGGKVLTDFGSLSSAGAAAVARQPNGTIIAAGTVELSGNFDFALARYNRDGSLDSSFGSGGKVTTEFESFNVDVARAVAVAPNGKIIAAGLSGPGPGSHFASFALARYNADGSLDPSFGSGGKVLTEFGGLSSAGVAAIALQANGKIVAVGTTDVGGSEDFALVRYDQDGSLDSTFGAGGKVLTDFGNGSSDVAEAVALQPNGRIVAAGVSGAGASDDFALARYKRDGSLDASFGSGGEVLTDFGNSNRDVATAVALEPTGAIVAAGFSTTTAGGSDVSTDFALARFNHDGSLDPSFGTSGRVLTDFGSQTAEARGVLTQRNGKIVAAGSTSSSLDSDFALARYKHDGSLDPSFGSGGKVLTDFGSGSVDEAEAVARKRNGKIVVVGFSRADPFAENDFALALYLAR